MEHLLWAKACSSISAIFASIHSFWTTVIHCFSLVWEFRHCLGPIFTAFGWTTCTNGFSASEPDLKLLAIQIDFLTHPAKTVEKGSRDEPKQHVKTFLKGGLERIIPDMATPQNLDERK